VDGVTRAIKYIVFIGGIVIYAYLYFTFLRDILDASTGQPPDLDNSNVQLATGIGGLLAAVFAVAFGIQRKDPTVDEKKLNLGATITPEAQWVTSISIVVYFLVGAATLWVSRDSGAETPQEIQATATVFAGYLAAIFTGMLTGPGKTQ
jgi:hypothetical protein